MTRYVLIVSGALILFALVAPPAGRAAVSFSEAEPVWAICDTAAIAEPAPAETGMNEWLVDSHWRWPLDDLLSLRASAHAGDINAFEQAVTSSWYRASWPLARANSPAPGFSVAIPTAPFAITEAHRDSPDDYLIARDARGEIYRLEFDDPQAPEGRTAAIAIASRLLSAAGYNVLPCAVTSIAVDEITLGEHARDIDEHGGDGKLSADALAGFVAQHAAGDHVRVAASRYPHGIPMGPFSDHGIRADDPNDHIPHEDRRVLRGFWPLACWLDHPGLRPDRRLDVFLQPAGYLRHYFVGFANTLSFLQWSNQDPGADTESFDPLRWSAGYPFQPYERSDYGDLFWGLETMIALDATQIRSAVAAARYSQPERERWAADALIARRAQVCRACLSRVNGATDFCVIDEGRGRYLLGYADLGALSGVRTGSELRLEMKYEWPGIGSSSGFQSRQGSGLAFDLSPFAPRSDMAQDDPHRYGVASVRAFNGDGRPLRGETRIHIRWNANGPEIAGIERL